MQVRWGEIVLSQFSVSNGVKQGDAMLPILFTVYLDNLLKILKQRNIGCKIDATSFGSICLYKDMMYSHVQALILMIFYKYSVPINYQYCMLICNYCYPLLCSCTILTMLRL